MLKVMVLGCVDHLCHQGCRRASDFCSCSQFYQPCVCLKCCLGTCDRTDGFVLVLPLYWQNLISEISVARRSLLASEIGARSSFFGLI
jgi:hypothetical protein